jgi:HlyD family secretion protein
VIRSRRVAVPLAVLVLAGTGVAAYGAASDDSIRYRTVAAVRGDVADELTLSGTIAPSATSELAFGTAGAVARVRVAQGDEVRQGQVIAVLDRSSLRAAVDRATSDLADARAQLASDRDAQSTVVDTATSSTAKGAGSTKTSGSKDQDPGSTGSNTELLAQLRTQQDAVTTAQSAATTALATASDLLAAQQQACADPAASEPEPTDDATTDAAAPSAVLSDACTSALAAVQDAQTSASDAQTTLQKALETLGNTLSAALGSASATTPSTPTPGATPTATPSTQATPAGSTRTVTAATLAQDQAAIDKAVAALAAARADLRGAVVRAPADGTVVSLAVGADDQVSAGDAVATLVAPGLTTATVRATATQAAQLTTGTTAEVTPAGATDALTAKVGRVEHTATTDSSAGGASSDPTYAVEIVLDDRDLAIADGMPATVAIEVGSADDVVVVPASAISNGTVTVVDDTGTARRTPVSTGVVGATEVEITDGLEAGDRVVLADLDAPLPTGDSSQQGGGLGGFGGDGVRMGPPGGSIAIRP